MGAWGVGIFSDALSMDVRREYNTLLSVGKDNNEIEALLIDYYSSILNCNDPDEDIFWFALAYSEWKKGRLSATVKDKALSALASGRDLKRWNTPENLKNYKKNTLLSPMPIAKKIRKPTVHHCPWPVGSLIAYRIVSNKKFENHSCFMKYVLLRVIKIVKHPLTTNFETNYYNESMFVGLYNWMGNNIPDPEIVTSLRFIPFRESDSLKPNTALDLSPLDSLPEESQNKLKGILLSLSKESVEKSVCLDWIPSKFAKGDITYLGCDESFAENVPEFFTPIGVPYSIMNFLPFDVTLIKRFEPYVGDNRDFDYVII